MATRSNIRTRARIRADQDQSTFPTDAQYNLLIDEAARDVWFDLAQAGWPPESENFAVTMNGAGSYPLGTARTLASVIPAYGDATKFFQWLDDGTDPADKNSWGLSYANHTNSPLVSCTLDAGTRTVLLDFCTNAGNIPLSAIKAAVDGSGSLTATGFWASNGFIAPPAPGFQAQFSGGTEGTGQVFSVVGVFRLDGSTLTELTRIQEGQRAALESTTGPASSYDLVGNQAIAKIRVYPPTATGTLRVKLVRDFPGLPVDGSQWNGPIRSDELVVLKAAIKGSRKEGNDQGAQLLEREYAVLLDKVQNMAGWLNGRHSALIRDVRPDLQLQDRPRDPFDFNV